MKTILVFDVPEEADALRLAQNGAAAHRVLHELREWLRNGIKHGKKPVLARVVWDRLHELASDEGLHQDDWC